MKELDFEFKTTKDIHISEKIVDQVIGQAEALNIIKKAALQRRHVLLIGQPGTGKSLIGQALAGLLSKEKLVDILCFHNDADENQPLIRTMPKGKGREFVNKLKVQSMTSQKGQNVLFFVLLIITMVTPWWVRKQYGDIMAAASLIGSMVFLAAFVVFMNLGRRFKADKVRIPKLLVDNSEQKTSPFVDGTGSHAGALLGDVLHDPLQSFYLETVVTKSKGKIKLKDEVDKILKKHKKELIKKGTYEAAHTKRNEFQILAEKNKVVRESEVLSVNKYLYSGDLIKIKSESGKELIVTPEHKIAIRSFFNKVKYVRANKLRSWHKIIALSSA
ncbi:MAG TPA: ATP-binding protein [Candidatus Nanoarchaeia archaeon]|nr:ATP-binding protein [Candidatus Nanoarchaeia archaeon]